MKDQLLRRIVAQVLAAASVSAMGTTSVLAQAAPPPAPPVQVEGERAGLEEIIVMSQRREQSLQEVPLSVTAFTPAELTRVSPVTIEDLNNLIPNTEIEHVGLFRGAASFSMRGIGTSGIESFADPAVAVFINGVYQPRNAIALSSTLDFEAIEVLRGPQGTIYGRNAFAGAIVLRTARPEIGEFSGFGRVNFGNFGQLDADLVANIPINDDTMAARIAVRSHQMDGYYRNNGIVDGDTVTVGFQPALDPNLKGRNIAAEKNLYLRPTFRWTPNDAFDLTVFGEYFRDRSEAGTAINERYDPVVVSNANCGPVLAPPAAGTGMQCPLATFELLGFPGIDPFGDGQLGLKSDGSNPYVVGFSLYGRPQDVDSYNVTVEANYTTDYGKFTGTLNYADVVEEVWSDTDGENANLFSSARWQDYNTYQFEGHFVSDFSDNWDIVAGLFYLWDEYQTGQVTFPSPSLANPATPPVYDTNLANLAYGTNTARRKSWAAYAQAEWHWTDELSLVFGGRYSWEEKYDAYGQAITNILVSGVPRRSDFSKYPVGPNAPVFGPIDESWDSFSPRLGVNYKLSDDLFLFGFWQRAYKSGGFNMNAGNAEVFNTPFGEEQVDNYEIGMKSEWFDNRLRVNANAFYSQFVDVQRSIIRPSQTTSGVITFTDNAADIDVYGVELEVSALVGDSWTLYGNVGWLDAEYTDFCAELDGAETTATPQSGRRVCGDTTVLNTVSLFKYLVETDWSDVEPVRAPEWDLLFGATWELGLGDSGSLKVDANWSYTSEMYVQLLNVPRSDREPLDTLNASATWTPDSDKYQVTVWGRNITDNVERLNTVPVANLFQFAHATMPRTYGVSLQVNFE